MADQLRDSPIRQLEWWTLRLRRFYRPAAQHRHRCLPQTVPFQQPWDKGRENWERERQDLRWVRLLRFVYIKVLLGFIQTLSLSLSYRWYNLHLPRYDLNLAELRCGSLMSVTPVTARDLARKMVMNPLENGKLDKTTWCTHTVPYKNTVLYKHTVQYKQSRSKRIWMLFLLTYFVERIRCKNPIHVENRIFSPCRVDKVKIFATSKLSWNILSD